MGSSRAEAQRGKPQPNFPRPAHRAEPQRTQKEKFAKSQEFLGIALQRRSTADRNQNDAGQGGEGKKAKKCSEME
jgi:hypothetical protein